MLPSVLTTTLSNSGPNVTRSSFKMAVNSSPPRFIRPSLGLGRRTRPLVQNLYTASKIAAGKAPTTSKSVRLSKKLDMPRDFRISHIKRLRVSRRSGNTYAIQCLEFGSTLRNLLVVHEIPLAAVAKEPLAFAWVVDDILRESLADDETDQRFGTVINRLVSRAGTSKPDEVAGVDFVSLISDDFRPTPRQNVDRLFFISVGVELRRLVTRRNRDQMNSEILKSNLIAKRFVNSNRRRVEIMHAPNTFHCGNLFSGQIHGCTPSELGSKRSSRSRRSNRRNRLETGHPRRRV